jgi:hypothetical protein
MDCETWFQARLGGISRSAIFCARSVATAHPLFDRLTSAISQTPPRKTATNNMSPLSRYIDPRPLEESSHYFQLLSGVGCKAMKFEPNLMTRALHSTAAVEPPPRGREQLPRASWNRFVWVEVRPCALCAPCAGPRVLGCHFVTVAFTPRPGRRAKIWFTFGVPVPGCQGWLSPPQLEQRNCVHSCR